MAQPKFNGRFTGQRYVIKFTNGVWIIFDRLTWQACEPFNTRKDATLALKG